MADHRRTPALRRLLAQFSLRGVSRSIRNAILVQLLVFSIAIPLVLILTVDIPAGIALAVVGLAGSLIEVWLAAARQREMRELTDRRNMLDDYEATLQNLQALTPDGAPTRAYWVGHCGCTHVQIWDGEHWNREQVVSLDTACPLVEAYGDIGGRGV